MPGSDLAPQAILKAALHSAHEIMEATMADVNQELANRPAPGVANPIGAGYTHAVIGEDAIVNGMLRGQEPFFATTWAGRTGADRPVPMHGHGNLGEWFHTVHVDVAACHEYARAVYVHSEDYVGSLDDAELRREIDTPVGKLPLGVAFAIFVIGHVNNVCGEIAALKGVAGLRGYPF